MVMAWLLPVAVSGNAPVDVVAAGDAESRTVSVGLINYSPKKGVSVNLEIDGADAPPAATAWRIHGPSLDAINVPGQPESVTTTRLPDPLPLDKQRDDRPFSSIEFVGKRGCLIFLQPGTGFKSRLLDFTTGEVVP